MYQNPILIIKAKDLQGVVLVGLEVFLIILELVPKTEALHRSHCHTKNQPNIVSNICISSCIQTVHMFTTLQSSRFPPSFESYRGH